jgi:hypothetical protein
MADRWAWPPLAVRATQGTHGSEPFTILGMPHTIPSVVHEWSSPHVLGGISSRALDTSSFTQPFHCLPQVGAAVPFLGFILLANLAFLPKNGPW